MSRKAFTKRTYPEEYVHGPDEKFDNPDETVHYAFAARTETHYVRSLILFHHDERNREITTRPSAKKHTDVFDPTISLWSLVLSPFRFSTGN